jgi:hypothetical protein
MTYRIAAPGPHGQGRRASAGADAGAGVRASAGTSGDVGGDRPRVGSSSSSAGRGKGWRPVRLVLPAAVGWQDSAPKALRFLTASAIPIGIAATVVLIAVWVLGRLAARRHLARRVAYDLLPATTFSPNAEDVLRFAAQLARTRPVASRLIPRRASSVRLRWHTNADGLLTLRLEGPASAASVLRHQTYAAVELRKAGSDASGPATSSPESTVSATP